VIAGITKEWTESEEIRECFDNPGESMSIGNTNHPLKHFGLAPLFAPEEGTTVVEPLGNDEGWWAGAPSAVYDDETRKFYLYYRLRRPRGLELERGGECVISESDDGLAFTPIWSAKKTDFESDSMERSALVKGLDGSWRLYNSYTDPVHKMWRTDYMEASSPDGFKPSERNPLFDPADMGIEGIKDPYVFTVGGEYQMILSYATRIEDMEVGREGEIHATADAYNTGLTVSRTGLATSIDGRHFKWQGDIFSPTGKGWDAWCRRICSLVYLDGVFTAFYDGASDVSGNYEERTGIASGRDMRSLTCLTPDAPALVSPHATGSLRYVDAIQFPRKIHYYYEYVRADGSHELRANVVPVVS